MKYLVFKIVLLVQLVLVSVMTVGQSSPVSQSANSMVDLNSGDFHYELPVMTVPGPNGEQVPISFNYYSGGIRMDDEASWIGLGWNYNPGEITHQVKGIADDWKNKGMNSITRTASTRVVESTNFYGPLYYKDLNYADPLASMDVGASNYKTSGLYNFPNYDKYNVSGMGIGGTMEPRLYDVGGKLYQKSKAPDYSYTNTDHYTKSPNFVFIEELNAGFNIATNRAHTASYIEMYTNAQIRTNYASLKAAGFLDYAVITGTRRPSANFDDDGIGAFRITTSNGMVYHYSLPVYVKENETSASFLLNASYGLDPAQPLEESIRLAKYAESWKLTAITGIDYVDANNNGIADVGDTGYWVAYNYGLFTDEFSWRFPYYNFKQNAYNKKVKPLGYGLPVINYKNEGTVSYGKTQKYYLNSIQTATHTAFFIKEVRLDAVAVKDLPFGTSGTGIKPSLRLSKIVLVRNENNPLLYTTASLPAEAGFSLTDCDPLAVQPHIGNFTANEALIKSNSLAIVELVADYSLCKLVYNNIRNVYTKAPVLFPCIVAGSPSVNYTSAVYEAASGTASVADNNSGKLTLNEVKIYAPNYKAAAPSTKFEYDQAIAIKNPNYNTDQTDYWGMYKSDFNFATHGRYTTAGVSGSGNNVDAWSLKKITTPLVGEILVEYESDNYNYVSSHGVYTNPQRYFLVSNAIFYPGSGSGSWWDITVSKEATDFSTSPLVNLTEGFIPYTPNIPATCPSPMVMKGSSATLSPVLTATTFTSTTQNFNLYTSTFSDYPVATCDPLSLPLTYNTTLPGGWGFLRFTVSEAVGGGVRVKQITLKDTETSTSYINEYSYTRGVAGSEPLDIEAKGSSGLVEKNRAAADPLAPASRVSYETTTVKSKSLNNTYMGKTVYAFYNSYEPNAMNKSADVIVPNTFYPYGPISITANYTATETRGILNNLESVTEYSNVDQIIKKVTYEYQEPGEIGAPAVESYKNAVTLSAVALGSAYTYVLKGYSTRANKVAHLKKKTTLSDGVTTIEEYLAWDAITGQPTNTNITNASAGVTATVIEPAFRNSLYAAMGPKTINVANTNQLNATSKVSMYRDKLIRNVDNVLVASPGDWELVDGTKTTWRQTYPKRVYDNATSKYITQSTACVGWLPYQTFIFNGSTNDAMWKYNGESTLFNNRLRAIETKNDASRFQASTLGYNQQYVLTTAGDAQYADFSFTGFEDQEVVAAGVTHFGGEFTQGQMRYTGDANIVPHTGNYAVKVDATAFGPGHFAKGFTKGRSYRISVWVHKNSPSTAQLVVTLDGSVGLSHGGYTITKSASKADVANVTVGDWTLMTVTIDVPVDYVESGGTLNDLRAYLYNPGATPAYYDDFMIRPVDATVSGSVVDEKTGNQMAVLDKNDFATKTIYDEANRVREIWTESPVDGWKLKKRFSYNFKRAY
jgi:hypothetical protein